VPIKKVETDS
jgi:hypothetical protein